MTKSPYIDMLEQARAWCQEGRGVALATVVKTWGSSPSPTGSQMVVDSRGAFAGSVSGGCIEGAVVEEAQGVIADGRPKLLGFGIANHTAWEVGLACGGRVEIFIEAVE